MAEDEADRNMPDVEQHLMASRDAPSKAKDVDQAQEPQPEPGSTTSDSAPTSDHPTSDPDATNSISDQAQPMSAWKVMPAPVTAKKLSAEAKTRLARLLKAHQGLASNAPRDPEPETISIESMDWEAQEGEVEAEENEDDAR
ncbi:hypothetical protein MRB53_038930 [Persea americana]|nr:hypothetical protein MRB53_038930 [Persea americana]